ncbi:hypothetical protein LUZ60_003001 [Juncus effusus]|nr:hypothetical protein LUZ60_003001 [Juncus effusus]
MKGNTAKLILFQQANNKANSSSGGIFSYLISHQRVLLLLFVSCFTFASLLTLFYSTYYPNSPQSTTTTHFNIVNNAQSVVNKPSSALTLPVIDALIHYAVSINSTLHMPEADMRAIAHVLGTRGPCNFLVFGLSVETPLWIALNSGGRTVFLDENQYYISYLEPRHPGMEAYDVSYTTHVRDLQDLLATARSTRATDCRPIQHLLFSECRLAVNDLPNHLYDVDWDVILIDGPSGWQQTSPGRTASIFSAAVMARSRRDGGKTDILVHDYQFGLEQTCCNEFLCEENYNSETSTKSLGHYTVQSGGPRDAFCLNESESQKSKTKTHRATPLIT